LFPFFFHSQQSNEVLSPTKTFSFDMTKSDELPSSLSFNVPFTSSSSVSNYHDFSTSNSTTSNSFDETLGSSNKEIQYDSNNVAALKEWAIICKAAEDGKQVLLFRKGGIMEYRNGFELKYKNFFLFPTFEHQSLNSIQGEYRDHLEKLEKQHVKKDQHIESKNNSNNTTNIELFVEITYFNEINDINTLEKLEKFHIWTLDYVKMRFNYNPKKPLYLMLLRTYKLETPIKIYNMPEWSGCKSWIQIDFNNGISKGSMNGAIVADFEYLKSISKPCIDDVKFNTITEEIRSIIK